MSVKYEVKTTRIETGELADLTTYKEFDPTVIADEFASQQACYDLSKVWETKVLKVTYTHEDITSDFVKG